MRVTCAAFVRLTVGGRIGLLMDDQPPALSPIGGVIKTTPRGKKQLEERCGVQERHYKREDGELSFHMQPLYVTPFRRWFRKGHELEPYPAAREFCEELGPEEHGLLSENEAGQVSFSFWKHREYLYHNRHAGHEKEVIGRGFFCIYRSRAPIELQRKLVLLSKHSLCPLKFVSIQEIENGQTARGVKIADICNLLV